VADASSPLGSVKVVDWTDQAGAYAGRLLADLGADVVRIETAGQPVPWPEERIPGTGVSAFERFVNLNKRPVLVDLDTTAGRELLAALIERADIVLTSGEAPRRWRQAGRPLRRAGAATHVHVSAFGDHGTGGTLLADDLVTLAAGGLLSMGGYPDGPPIAVYGAQAYLAGGINAAVAALFGLLAADAGGAGADLDVSIQAVLASALEDAAAEYDLTGVVRRRAGDAPREAGTGVFACADGWIAVVAGKLGTAAAWDSLVTWLCEQGVPGAEALKAPEWSTLEHRRLPASIATFQQLMETATVGFSRQQLYAELQRRRIAAAPVNSVADMLADPQLVARGYFRQVRDAALDRDVTYPGPPYRLDDHDLPGWSAAPPGDHDAQVLRDWLGAGAAEGQVR
jgi:benzylsuccinate CoA-transferase BbsE subunit